MQLNQIMNEIRPAAEAARKHKLSFAEANRAFALTYVAVSVEENGNNQKEAAKSMGISQAYVSKILHGTAKVSKPSPKKIDRPVADVVGEMQL